MRILFTSTKGEGHIRPLLPYAKAVAALGHEVLVAAPEVCAPIVAKAGLEHHVFDNLSGEELEAIWAPHRGVRGDDMMKIALPKMFAGPTARKSMPRLREAVETWRPDVIVRESLEYAGLALAETHGIPHARVNVHNCVFESRVNQSGHHGLFRWYIDLDYCVCGYGLYSTGPVSSSGPSIRRAH